MQNPKLKNFNLKNKVALITGAGGLLGAEHALALLECGAKVVLTDVTFEKLEPTIETLMSSPETTNYLTHAMDVTQLDEIANVAEKLSSKSISVDILINNAAIDSKVDAHSKINNPSTFENFSLLDWGRELSVGLTGAFLCTQVFGKTMVHQGKGGVILNIASDLSIIAPDQRIYKSDLASGGGVSVKPPTYSVIKHGLVGLTKYTATYWADKNIRCNALSPGGVFAGQGDEFVTRLSSLIPMGRMAFSHEYRSAVQFLCSDASSYMTGQNIIMDGGRSVW